MNCCLGKFDHGKLYFSDFLQNLPVLFNNRVSEWVENGHKTNYSCLYASKIDKHLFAFFMQIFNELIISHIFFSMHAQY